MISIALLLYSGLGLALSKCKQRRISKEVLVVVQTRNRRDLQSSHSAEAQKLVAKETSSSRERRHSPLSIVVLLSPHLLSLCLRLWTSIIVIVIFVIVKPTTVDKSKPTHSS